MSKRPRNARRDDQPMTADDLLRRDDIPASEPVPEEIAARLAVGARIMLSSDDPAFDPRKAFTKVKGYPSAWALTADRPVTDGLPVQALPRIKPGSLKRAGRGPRVVEAFRPPWQPHVYHPRTVAAGPRPRLLTRKNGAKVRPHTVYNHDDRETFFPQGYPWHCIGRVFVSARDANGSRNITGTGTLVGSRTVLTSAHLIPWDLLGPSVMIKFVPGYFTGRSVVGPGVQSMGTHVSGYAGGAQLQAWDLAVVRLADPLGDMLGTMGARTYEDDWEDDPRWTLVGYPGEIDVAITFAPFGITSTKVNGEFPTRQFGISVEDDDAVGDALEIEHRGDSTDGNSGARCSASGRRGRTSSASRAETRSPSSWGSRSRTTTSPPAATRWSTSCGGRGKPGFDVFPSAPGRTSRTSPGGIGKRRTMTNWLRARRERLAMPFFSTIVI